MYKNTYKMNSGKDDMKNIIKKRIKFSIMYQHSWMLKVNIIKYSLKWECRSVLQL